MSVFFFPGLEKKQFYAKVGDKTMKIPEEK